MTQLTASDFYDRYWQFRIQRGDHMAPNRIKLRHEQAAAFLCERLPVCGAKILDLGCGDGLFAQSMGRHDHELTGADIASAALSLARPHYRAVRRLDLDNDATPAEWLAGFDAVVCLEVLEHLEKPKANIQRSFDLCRKGGLTVFSFPNLFSWKNRWSFLRGRWPGGYTTFDPREHLQVFELDVFRTWLVETGFEWLGTSITPDLPKSQPLRRWMFQARRGLNRMGPSLWAMQINVYGRRPTA